MKENTPDLREADARATHQRRTGAIVFLAGLLGVVMIGCALAATDLWGGVRTLGLHPRFLALLMAASVLAMLVGAVHWLNAFPTTMRVRKGLLAAAAIVCVGVVGGGALFAYYAARRESSNAQCARATCLLTREARERELEKGLGPLFPVIDPGAQCMALERERRALDRKRDCPVVVYLDTPCRCGKEEWMPGPHASACPNGPTTCQYRDGGTSLGCAERDTADLLAGCPEQDGDRPPTK